MKVGFMDVVPFGKTTLSVSKLGLGLAALGRPGYITLGHADDLNHTYTVTEMESHAHTVLDAAYAGGIGYFDAARSYGRAEAFLRSWLQSRNIAPGSVTVGSKWGYTYTANWQIQAEAHEIKEHSLPKLKQQWAQSQAHLGQYLNLYQIHSATLESGVLENEAVLKALARLKAETGVAMGLSVSGAQQAAVIDKAIQVEIDGVQLFDSIQATWNLLEPSAGVALASAAEAGLGIIIKEALANGRLTRDTLTDQQIEPAQFQNLKAVAQAHHCTLDQLALAAVLAQPWVDVVLSGAAQVAHLRSNIEAVDVAWNDALFAELAGLAEPADLYWQKRGNLKWN